MEQNYKIVKENFYKFINPLTITEKNGIVYFNADNLGKNDYPQALINRYTQSSSIHANLINLKRRLTYASGLVPVDKKNSELITFLNKKNIIGDDNNDVYLKVCLDYAIHEMAALQLLYNTDGSIGQILHLDISKLRAEEPDDYGIVRAWWYSKDWLSINGTLAINDKRFSKPQAVRIPTYNPETYKEDEYRQVYVMKRYTTGQPVYSIVSYNAGLNAVDTDYELSLFHLNSIKNGFLPSAIISLIGQPSEEEKDKFIREFNATQTGTRNIKALFMWLDNMENKPTFERMATDTNADLFTELKRQVVEDIAVAHGAGLEVAQIAGTQGATLGGDTNKLNVSRLAFVENVIKDFQRVLIKGFNNIYRHNELGEVIVVNEPLKIAQPVPQATDLTEEERRDILYGLEPKVTETIPTVNE